jgi:peptidoglycan/LPS O-acetylase OafA/YrhL
VCIPLGWLLMLPDEFENLGQGLFATVISCNNLLLWLTSGYWDLSTEFKPLLHTWSLGVEEQFYLIFPWVLWFVFRRRGVMPTLIIAGAASLALAEWTNSYSPKTSFFMLHTRAFELIAGSILAYAEFRRGEARTHSFKYPRGLMVFLGLAMIAASVVFLDGASRMPGLLSMIPVGGTMLIIWYAGETIPGGRLLCHPILVGVGLISYSLYLWHQPLLAFLRISSAEPPSVAMSAAVVALAFPLAWISWRFVERPFRQSGAFGRTQVFAMTIIGGLAIGGMGLALDRFGGFPERVPEIGSLAESDGRHARRATYVDRMNQLEGRAFSDDSKPNALILGNSFARDFLNGVIENNYLSQHEISYHRVSWKDELSCRGNVENIPEKARKALSEADVAIFVLGAFETECWRDHVSLYREIGAKRIIVVGTKSFGWNPNAIMVLRGDERRNFRPQVVQAVRRQNDLDRQRVVDAEFVDLIGMVMDEQGRVPLVSPDGRLISEDGGHLTKAGARYIGKLLFEHPVLRDLK